MLNHKEFFFWLDGYLTNRSWTVVKESDIDVIKEKMKEVKGELDFDVNKNKVHKLTYPFNPINPIIGGVNDDLGYPPKIVM